jgi:hypothetical protein
MFIDNRKYFHKVQYKKSTNLHALLLIYERICYRSLMVHCIKKISHHLLSLHRKNLPYEQGLKISEYY